MLQLNLLPDVKKELLHAKRMRNLVMTICFFVSAGAVIAAVLLGLGLGALAIKKSSVAGEVDKNIAEIEAEKITTATCPDGMTYIEQNIESQQCERPSNSDDDCRSSDSSTYYYSSTDKKCYTAAKKAYGLGDYLSAQNDLSLINSIKENQPQLSRIFNYLDVIFGRTTPIVGLHWNDWDNIKIEAADTSATDGVTVELSGQVESLEARLMLRNRLYYAMVKYSEYTSDSSGTVVEGDTKTDQKLFPTMVPTVDFEGSPQDESTGGWPFKATLVFNPIVFQTKYRIQAIEVDFCTVWSATYGVIGDGCQGRPVEKAEGGNG
jgi:hypothetical protein